jgi:cation:H+ antiporter
MSEIATLLISGIVLLLFSTKTLIKLSETLSLYLKLSPLFIGMTVIAIGTSLPELSVSSIASIKGDINLAVGNIVGSNIINVLLVFAVGILIGKLRIGTTKTPRNAIILLIITLVYSFLHKYELFPKQILGMVFLSGAFMLTFFEYQWALFGRSHEDNKNFKNTKKVQFTLGKTIMLFLSIVGVIVGGYLIVNSTEKLSVITGLSTGILGLTLTAVSTSLPELLTAIFSQENHDEKMTIGNIIGSNIYNLLLIGGVINIFGNDGILSEVNWLTLNIITIIFVSIILIYKGKIVPKWLGVLLLVCFFGYMYMETHI